MTTIAYKDGVLAADSKVTSDSVYAGTAIKLVKSKRYLLAACGNLNCVHEFLRWGKRGFKEEERHQLADEMKKTDVDFTGVSVDPNGMLYEYDGTTLPAPVRLVKGMYAIGSGSEFALGAMAAGCSAREAIKIASLFDVNTGGKIRELNHAE